MQGIYGIYMPFLPIFTLPIHVIDYSDPIDNKVGAVLCLADYLLLSPGAGIPTYLKAGIKKSLSWKITDNLLSNIQLIVKSFIFRLPSIPI